MTPSRIVGALAAAVLASTLVACSSTGAETPTGDSAAAGDTFPVTIEHAFGETVIESKPERVATVAWANQEVPLALGVVPVGMESVDWGDDDGDGILPWAKAKIDELGGETPVLFSNVDGLDYEAIADTQPDVILASYSGLTQEEYDTLSKIAPTVAYPEVAWGTSMDDMIRMNGAALGLADEAEALVTTLGEEAAADFAAQPALAGKKVVWAWFDPTDASQIGFYTNLDTRPTFLTDLGMVEPQVVADMSEGTDQFFVQVSSEQADLFSDVDLFITYGGDDTVAALQADPLIGQIPAIKAGHVAILQDATPLAAAANPSPLSIGATLTDYFGLLAGALA